MASFLAKYSTANVDSNLVALFVSVVFGAAAITSQDGHKVVITRTGVGLYKASLAGPFNRLYAFDAGLIAAAVRGTTFEVVSVALLNSATDPSFTFRAVNTAGAEADPTSGDTLLLNVVLRNSATPRKGG